MILRNLIPCPLVSAGALEDCPMATMPPSARDRLMLDHPEPTMEVLCGRRTSSGPATTASWTSAPWARSSASVSSVAASPFATLPAPTRGRSRAKASRSKFTTGPS